MIRFVASASARNICFKGEDVRTGDVLLKKGTLINPAAIAVMASAGYPEVKVYRQAVVGIASTGDELYPPGKKLPQGAIRDSNSYQLETQVRKIGMLALNRGIVKDTPESISSALEQLEKRSDVIILSGGVSLGDYDLVPDELLKAGYEKIFHKVAVKPGMPLWFGQKQEKFCFGLPGNPVSAFVQFEFIIKPFLYAMSGHSFHPKVVQLPLAGEIRSKKSDRDSIIPVKLDSDAVIKLEYHGSADINAIPDADGFIMIRSGTTLLKKGEMIDVRLL
jgi:molybdopterin molybdotransferase